MQAENTPVLGTDRPDEVTILIAGKSIKVRFGLKFLKALTDREGGAGPADVLERLQAAPFGALLDMAEQGIRLSKAARTLPDDVDILDELDELPRAELQKLFKVLLHSVTQNPLVEVLTQGSAS